MEIIPAINAFDFAVAKRQAAVIKSFLPRGGWVHLDVSDGVFSAVKNWGEAVEFKDLKLGFYKTEVHLMVENPEDAAEMWLKEIALPRRNDKRLLRFARNDGTGACNDGTGASLPCNDEGSVIASPEGAKQSPRGSGARIIAHLEAIRNSSHILDLCQKYGADLMIAINLETMVENLIPYFHNIKYFQILAVAPGRSGQKFQDIVWEKIRFLRERAPDAIIEIDGGVNLEIITRARELGVDMAVSGSYIMDAEEPGEAYRELSGMKHET